MMSEWPLLNMTTFRKTFLWYKSLHLSHWECNEGFAPFAYLQLHLRASKCLLNHWWPNAMNWWAAASKEVQPVNLSIAHFPDFPSFPNVYTLFWHSTVEVSTWIYPSLFTVCDKSWTEVIERERTLLLPLKLINTRATEERDKKKGRRSVIEQVNMFIKRGSREVESSEESLIEFSKV